MQTITLKLEEYTFTLTPSSSTPEKFQAGTFCLTNNPKKSMTKSELKRGGDIMKDIMAMEHRGIKKAVIAEMEKIGYKNLWPHLYS